MLLVVRPQLHPEVPGSLNFCPLCLILQLKIQGREEVFSWIHNENRVKKGYDFPGVSLALIWDRNFSGSKHLPRLATSLAVWLPNERNNSFKAQAKQKMPHNNLNCDSNYHDIVTH